MNWQILLIIVLTLFISCSNDKNEYRYELQYSDEADSIKSVFYNLRDDYSIISKDNGDQLVDEELLDKINGEFIGGVIHSEFPANMTLFFRSEKVSLNAIDGDHDVLLSEIDRKNNSSFKDNVVRSVHEEDKQLDKKQIKINQYVLYNVPNDGYVAYQDNFYTHSSTGKLLKILVLYGQLKYKDEMVEIAQEMDMLFKNEK